MREGATASGGAIVAVAGAVDAMGPAFATAQGIAEDRAMTVGAFASEARHAAACVSGFRRDAGTAIARSAAT